MRLIAIVAAVTAALAGAMALAFHLLIVGPIERMTAPATPANARVDMLAGKPDALVLMPFVTGDVPRLVRGDALERLSRELWFTDNTDAGNLAGAVVLGMMGMPPTTSIATAFRDGVATKDFACLTAGCINWPTTDTEMWGLGRLRGLGKALGPEMKLEQQSFTDHAAYKAAHAAVIADPLRWFAKPEAEALVPAPGPSRLMTIWLPTRLVARKPGDIGTAEDEALKSEMKRLSASLLEGVGGWLEDVHGLAPMPLWAMKDGQLLRGADGGTRALPDLVQHDLGLRLRVAHEHVETVRKRGAALPPARRRNLVLEPALARAFTSWNIDRACLPGCADVSPTREFREKVETDIAAEPFWTLDVWRIPRDATP